MNSKALQAALKYIEDQQADVQITGPRYSKLVDWVLDFKSDLHTRVCYEELVDAGFLVRFNPDMGGTNYYVRVV